jgi:hypothetical protein
MPSVDLVPVRFGTEVGFPAKTFTIAADYDIPTTPVGVEIGFQSGLDLSIGLKRQVPLVGGGLDMPSRTSGGTEGQVLTQHVSSIPTWEDGTIAHEAEADPHPVYLTEDEVLNLITPVWYDCDSLTIIDANGTLVTGAHTDLHAMGGTLVDISEATGAPGIEVELAWSGITSFSVWHVDGWYQGGASHHVHVQLYNNDTTNWDSVAQMDTLTSQFVYSGSLADPAPYISAGAVKMRFYHDDAGNISHDLYLDHVRIGLSVGGGGTSSGVAEELTTAEMDDTLVLRPDGAGGVEWVAPAVDAHALDDLSDVNAAAPANTQVLTWDSTPGEWIAADALAGADGADGATWFAQAAEPVANQAGDLWLDTDDGEVYEWSGAAWVSVGNITGAAGTNGTDGADGSLWFAQAAAPIATQTGDLWLDTDNGDVSQWDGAQWNVVDNITGPAGADGASLATDVLWAAAGDIAYATANDTATVLTIGSAGDVLQVVAGLPAWGVPAASAISIADVGNDFTATNVEGALDELQADNEAHVAAADPHTGYVLESLLDAKGDLIVATADNTPARLAVGGTAGHVLTVDAGEATGMKWAAGAAGGDITTDPAWAALGDLIVATGNNTAAVLGIGSTGEVLTVVAGTASWEPAAAALTVRDESGTVSDAAVATMRFPDGTVVDNGAGDVSIREVPTGVILAEAYKEGVQSVPTATYTALTMDTEVVDGSGFHSTSSDTSRFTCPAGLGGWYFARGQSNAVPTTGMLYLLLAKNGSTAVTGNGVANGRIAVESRQPGTGADSRFAVHGFVYLAPGDFVELMAQHTVAGNQDWGVSGDPSRASRIWLFKLGSGNVAGLDTARAVRTSGNITLNSTSWANVNTGLDLVVPAQVGDVLLVTPDFMVGNQAVSAGLDVATIVSDSPVNTVGAGSDYGAWYLPASVFAPVGGPVQYVVQAGDISGGNVTLRLRYKTTSATNRTFYAGGGGDLLATWSVVNLRSQAVRGYAEGTAFPTGIASGTKFYRTDVRGGMLFRYDGTRWVSDQEFTMPLAARTLAAAITIADWAFQAAVPLDYDIYLTRWDILSYVATTNNGSHYWTHKIYDLDDNDVPASIATSGHAADTWTILSVNVNTVITCAADTGSGLLLGPGASGKTGSPGALYTAYTLYFRLIAT